MESLPQKTRKKEEELMDLIYKEKKYIFDFYSIHDLLSLIHYANNDKKKIFYLLDNYSKEENLKNIEANIALSSIKNNNKDKSSSNTKQKKIEKFIIISKTIKELQEKGDLTKSEEINIIWDFIHHQGINFIDLYDALNSFDKNKLYNKIKQEIKEKNKKNGADKKDKFMANMALINELNKRFEKKEDKIYEKYINNFEENDIYYLKKTGKWKYYSKILKEKEKPKNEIIEKQNQNTKLYDLLINISKNQRSIIFSFMDIFNLGKLGLCNKTLYKLIFKEFNININTAKNYIIALFANSKLYEIDPTKIKTLYKNSFLEMFKNKPRIKFCGVYYARVKIIREYFKYGIDYVNNGALIYYRVLRFFPNGAIYAMSCPYFKSHRIKHGIKEGSIEFKKGKFNIDENDNILVKYTNGDEYTYRLGWCDFSIYRMGFKHDDPGIKNGIELLTYQMVDKYGEKTKIKLDENFPRRFRFRNLEYLKNDIYIHKVEEYNEVNEVKNDELIIKNEESNNTIGTLSTEENSINKINN